MTSRYATAGEYLATFRALTRVWIAKRYQVHVKRRENNVFIVFFFFFIFEEWDYTHFDN